MQNENGKKEYEPERIRKHAKYMAKKLYGIRCYNAKEIRKVFKKQIIPLLEKQDVNYSISFITGEKGLMEIVNLGIQNGFSFRRWGEGKRYDILPELERLINNRYLGFQYYKKHYNDYLGQDLERLDERNYATGLNEVEIYIYKSHLDLTIIERDIVLRYIDYVDNETLL